MLSTLKSVQRVLSVKSTATREQRRLPPLKTTGSILSAQKPIPLPRIRSSSTADDDDCLAASAPAQPKRSEPLPSYERLFGVTAPDQNTLTAETTFSTSQNGNSTSLAGGCRPANGAIDTDTDIVNAAVRNHLAEFRAKSEQVKASGIRTCPILAVLSIFFCCPLIGLFSAIITLRAENSFYKGYYVLAHKEAFVSRICTLLAMVTGVIIYVGLVITVIVLRQRIPADL